MVIVYGLEAKDFIVADDSVEQSARLDEAPEGQPFRWCRHPERTPCILRISAHPRPQNHAHPLFALGTARAAIVEFDSQVELTRDFTKDESLSSRSLQLQAGRQWRDHS